MCIHKVHPKMQPHIVQNTDVSKAIMKACEILAITMYVVCFLGSRFVEDLAVRTASRMTKRTSTTL